MSEMSTIYAAANQKGGVSKTTTTYNLAAALAEQGRHVLVVDLDQQGSLTRYAGLNPDSLSETIYDVLKTTAYATRQKPAMPMTNAIHNVRPNLDLVPANKQLVTFDVDIVNATQREYVVQRAIEPMRKLYDQIIIDCPPNLGLLVLNALVASDKVIIPLQTDYLAAQGVNQLMETVEFVQDRLNSNLSYAGILLTLADERILHTREIIAKTRKDFADTPIRVYTKVVKMSARVKESPITGESILEYDPTGDVAAAYRSMARELLEDEERG
jgi:chromosome partitioning protein